MLKDVLVEVSFMSTHGSVCFYPQAVTSPAATTLGGLTFTFYHVVSELSLVRKIGILLVIECQN